MKSKKSSSSWETSSRWYDDIVGKEGHFYHQEVIFPELEKQLDLRKAKILDVGCGQGILSRWIPKTADYVGIDLSSSLIEAAQKRNLSKTHRFFVKDAQDFSFANESFTHAFCILSLQNIPNPLPVFQNIAQSLTSTGKLIIVLNHPCFRIPRQSSWQVDEAKKLQYRRIDRYYTPLEIPIQMNPSQKEKSTETFSFHSPLSTYFLFLKQSGFVIELLDEWRSSKKSTGMHAKMENRAREEFPLFLTIFAKKQTD